MFRLAGRIGFFDALDGDAHEKSPGMLKHSGAFWVNLVRGGRRTGATIAASGETLLARTDGAGQAAVIHSVGVVPQGLAEFDATTQDFDLFGATGRSIGGLKAVILVGDEVFIVTVAKDGFENVFAVAHKR
ncbi:hypothetical protein [Crateriforma spongiae]|uniref:hypothetical protein n=1 Tax=Crateriforma spongiae TaxID=2724528 RepID=UPI00197FA2F2|nr:hypothetical protein [Crateriforma spongiae]